MAAPGGRLARRDFLTGAGLALIGAAAAAAPAFLWSPSGPRARLGLLESVQPAEGQGLIVLDQSPLRAEAPLTMLDGAVTPVPAHFVQGDPPPDLGAQRAWAITIAGAVERPIALEAGAVPTAFPVVSRPLLLECASNGAAAFCRPAGTLPGPAFAAGAVGNALWTGVRLKDVLSAAGLRPGAAGVVATAHDGTAGPVLPLAKAMDDGTLLAFGMGGEALLPVHGAPLRLVVPGWPEAYSRKWLTRLDIVSNAGRTAALTVKSLITAPGNGDATDQAIEVRGAAWSGDRGIRRVEVSNDFGRTWRRATLEAGPRHAWTRWYARLHFPARGYAEIWARATDDAGATQPAMANPAAGRNDAIHRIWITVA